MNDKREIIFVYGEGKNKKFIQEIAKRRNHSVSYVVNFIINHFRENQELQDSLATYVPVFVKKTAEWKAKRNKKAKPKF